jgi:hypothetical protein
MPWLLLNFSTSQLMTRSSQSSPPRWLSPLVALTSTTPSPISSRDTSNVPPPRSKTRMVWSFSPLSSPYASAAAVGSLTMRSTLRPAIWPGLLGGLALGVLEVRRDGDDGVGRSSSPR